MKLPIRIFCCIACLSLWVACSDEDVIKQNELPTKVALLSPTDLSENVTTKPVLEWEAAQDVDGDEIVYFVYLDEGEATTQVAGDYSKTSFAITSPLKFNTNYHWKVVARDVYGASTQSAVSSFTTENDPPTPFKLIAPTDNAERLYGEMSLLWEASGNSDEDAITYDIYFGTEADPTTQIASGLSADELERLTLEFEPSVEILALRYNDVPVLNFETTYYWKVIATDEQGDSYESDIFSFTTDFIPKWGDTQASGFPVIADHSSVVFDDKIWVIGSQVYAMGENAFWQQVEADHGISNLYGHSSVVYDGKMWIIGGAINGIYSSPNGEDWTEVNANPPFSTDVWHTSVVFDDKIWVIGGYQYSSGENNNEVWYSTNGTDWTEVTPSQVFSPRRGHSSFVYDNKMWVIGGSNFGGNLYNDVWYSEDGINWIEATSSAAFPPRTYHSSMVYNDKMWVIGGSNLRDTWYSTNGTDWELLEDSYLSFPDIEKHTSLVYKGTAWILGGSSYSTIYDVVWASNF